MITYSNPHRLDYRATKSTKRIGTLLCFAICLGVTLYSYRRIFHDVTHYGSKLDIDSDLIDVPALNQQSQGKSALCEYLRDNYHNTNTPFAKSSYHETYERDVLTKEMVEFCNQVQKEFRARYHKNRAASQGRNVPKDFKEFDKQDLVVQTTSNSSEHPIQFATFLTENGSLDLYRNEFVKRILWIHIPKTGTSIFNTLYLHFCPKILESYPEIAKNVKPKNITKVPGSWNSAKSRALSDRYLINQFNPDIWCNASFYNCPRVGYHHPYKTKKEKFMTFTMLRDPTKRLRSAFSFRNHNNIPHHSLRKDPDITFDEYIAEPHIQNCQLKMILGFRCEKQVNEIDLDVEKALHRISSPFFFFGMTDRWSESICLFHYWFGGSMQPYEMFNNRPTVLRDVLTSKVTDSLDQLLFEGSTIIFEHRLSRAGCVNQSERIQ